MDRPEGSPWTFPPLKPVHKEWNVMLTISVAEGSSGPIRYSLVSLVFPEELSVSIGAVFVLWIVERENLAKLSRKWCYSASRSFGAFVEVVGQEMTGE